MNTSSPRLHPVARFLAIALPAVLAVWPLRAAVVLDEPFDYPDGSLITVSGGRWSSHSGTAGQVDVAAGAVRLTQAETEDVNALLGGGPYAADSGAMLYAKFTVRFTALPDGAGTYFAHFKDATTSGFRCRVFASVNGAAEGKFRLGISEAANTTTAFFERDLSLDTPYVVVVRYDTATAASTLWVDPAAESDPAVSASDDAAPVSVVAFALRQSLSAGNGMGTLVLDDLRVATSFAELFGSVTDAPPQILTPPESQSVAAGGTVTFRVVASGTPPLYYQWQRAQTNLPGAVNSALTLSPVTAADAGAYRVIVSNAFGVATSDEALLTVTNAGPASVVTNIAYLHTLLDPVNLTPADTTTLFTVEGIVTTWVNLTTSAHGLFYLQDETGGIAVFHSGAAGQVPPAGARVRVTAPLSHFNGLLELAPVAGNPDHAVATLSTGNPLPAPRPTSPTELAGLSAADIEAEWEGRLITFTNVTAPPELTVFASGSNVIISDDFGYPFTLRIDARTDIGGQAVPKIPFAIIGVLSQFDTSNPRDSGYQILPSRYADIITPIKPPTVRFTNELANLVRPGYPPTNAYTELGLRVGERLTLRVTVTDPFGGNVTVRPDSTGLPSEAVWDFATLTGPLVQGTFTMTARPADRGRLFEVKLDASNASATHTAVWQIYVPTAAEERVAIAEYLANPTGNTNAAHYNPLRRDPPTDNPSQHDEYLELVNLSDTDLDLRGWSIADAVQVRHRFYESFVLGAKNAAIVYGGPLNGLPPVLDVPFIPASEGSAGLALNNDGDTLTVRNQLGGVIERVVYTAAGVSSGGSMTRYPTLDHGFVPQISVATLAVTPGRQYDGKLWSEPPTLPPTEVGALAAARTAQGAVRLTWTARAGQTYAVLAAPAVTGPWTPLAAGLTAGEYTDTPPPGTAARFYRVSAP
jgi:hypothetical protein